MNHRSCFDLLFGGISLVYVVSTIVHKYFGFSQFFVLPRHTFSFQAGSLSSFSVLLISYVSVELVFIQFLYIISFINPFENDGKFILPA